MMEYILKPNVHLDAAEKEQAARVGAALSLDPVLTEILFARGVNTQEKIQRFLHPRKEDLHDPFAFQDMEKACSIIRGAVDNGERIWIYGDYDADGTSAAALLWRALRRMGASVSCFIPDRAGQGYGLTKEVIEGFSGWSVLITVDCGITNAEEVAFARSLGMKTIVTDHHNCPAQLPAADAVLNPKVPGETYPFRELCGAGVALKLAQALIGDEALQLTDLAAVGTVADMVSLTDENRVIVTLGLEKLNRDPNPGLRALSRELDRSHIDAETISFHLAPCINAAGRITSANLAFNLLTDDVQGSVNGLSKVLAKLNATRRERQQAITAQAEARIAGMETVPEAIVLWDSAWETGLVGLAAGHLSEKYRRPAVLLGERDGFWVGSARSVPGFDIYKALSAMAPLFVKFGGHTGAAGLTIPEDHLEELAQGLNAYTHSHLLTSARESADYDVEIALPAAPSLIDAFACLEPCGQENPQPRVLVRHAALTCINPLSGGRHTAFRLRQGSGELDAVMFRTAPESMPPSADVIGTVSRNDRRGGEPQMIVSVVSGEEEDDKLFLELAHEVCSSTLPEEPWRFFRPKQRMGLLYSALRAQTQAEGAQGWRRLYHGIRRRIPDATKEEFVFSVCVFTQLKLLEGAKDGKIRVTEGGPKRDLASSSIYRNFSTAADLSA